ncbi:dihydrofolate reductase family protein [Dactylosporangium sp. NPDC051485]|uniref:dihydrofolate reductase family protein n=1 Tax=Dactylosporangium sp. NPDC051485 TaxID=3154846 RepID=UPI0034202851
MRKLVVFTRVSLNGAYARGDETVVNWSIPDPSVDRKAHELMSPDTVVFGRLTYQVFENVWPAVAADPNMPAGMRKMGEELNEMTKVVFSRTLTDVEWVNTELYHGDVEATVGKLKEGTGGDIVIFGSGEIVRQLANADLVDEYLLAVTPVVLDDPKLMFEGVKEQKMKLIGTHSFDSGNVLLHYAARQA